jgi:hypothetical protein
VAGLKLIA